MRPDCPSRPAARGEYLKCPEHLQDEARGPFCTILSDACLKGSEKQAMTDTLNEGERVSGPSVMWLQCAAHPSHFRRLVEAHGAFVAAAVQ
ncbi:hypothetical protein GN956_G16498 [Arapaima gigas]